MKKRIGILLLSAVFLASCKDYSQKDWHINTTELADKYFPKYFEAIEDSLLNNNIKFEKEYSEEDNEKFDCKHYIAVYNVSKDICFKFLYTFDKGSSDIDCYFHYNFATEEQALNLPQNYINVMIDVVNFCAHNFSGTGEMYNTFYNEVKEKYAKNEVDGKSGKQLKIFTGEKYEDAFPSRGINLGYANEEYNLAIYLRDYLTDINIWDK